MDMFLGVQPARPGPGRTGRRLAAGIAALAALALSGCGGGGGDGSASGPLDNQWGLRTIKADRAYRRLEAGEAPGSRQTLGAIDSATAHERRSQLPLATQSSNGNEVDGVWKKWLAALMNVGGLDVYVCQCEEVTRGELLDVQPPRYLDWESDQMSARDLGTLTQDGPVNPDQVKRLTRAGMGHCQGRRCREQVAMLLADESDTPLTEVPIMSYRPPVRPLPLRIMWAHDESQQVRDDWVVWFKHSRDYMREMQEAD